MAPLLIAAAVGLLVVAAVVLFLRGGSADDKTASSSAVYREHATPFTFDGARFEVKLANSSPWAAKMRRRQPPPAGRRWVAVAVPVRNVSRSDLRPRALGHRIVTPAAFVIGPKFLEVRAGSLDGEGRLAKGKLTGVHVAFQVPEGVRNLTFALDAGGIGRASVRVRLGPLA